ncbi:MAG: xylose isomerase [Spirochaeta sp.]|nr:xylose isomerase [Spirochaeta sp.]
MKEFFKDIPVILYEGKSSKNPFAFKYYDPEKKVVGKTMKEHLRFSMSYWHTMTGSGADPFGLATMIRSWDGAASPMDLAEQRVLAAFELMHKLQIPYFCFHDRDIAPEGGSLAETNKNLDSIVKIIKTRMTETGIKVLWGTANLFSHPRYVHGAATSCNAEVFAYAAAQVKKALEVTCGMGGANYVFWGGREGYDTLLNTNMELELDNLARFLSMALDYAGDIGFKGQYLIEPKPKEPTKHQYDFDVAAALEFLRKYGIDRSFKLNIEANHATLAAHSFQHELHFARINGVLGSIDANQGDLLLGWDTDHFPSDIYSAVLALYEVLKNGGLHSGGLNFDAKTRRASFEAADLFHAYITGMDTYARGLVIANSLLQSGELEDFISARYASYSQGIGKEIVEQNVGFKELEQYTLKQGYVLNSSGQQERLEGLLNTYITAAG